MIEFRRIPTKDEDFNTFLNEIHTYLNAVPPGGDSAFTRLGVDLTVQTSFNDKFALWSPNWALYSNVLTRTGSVIHTKDNQRDAIEPVIREIQNVAEFNVNLTQDDREVLRVPKRDEERTRIEAPTAIPDLTIDKREHLVITIRIHNQVEPDTNSKPHGVEGVEVFQFIGDTPPPVKEWTYVGSTGRFLFPVVYTEADAKETAHIIARYRNRRGEVGPFSDPIVVDVS